MTEKNRQDAKLGYGLIDHPLNGQWWILDSETSSLSRSTGEIIQLNGALIDHLQIKRTFTHFICPQNFVSPGVLRLTHITQDELDRADPPHHAIDILEEISQNTPLLFWDGNFQLPFLEKLFKEGKKEFTIPHMLLDIGIKLVLKSDFDHSPNRLIKALGITVNSDCDNKYLNRYVALFQFLAQKLEQQDIHTTSQLEQLFEAEINKEDSLG